MLIIGLLDEVVYYDKLTNISFSFKIIRFLGNNQYLVLYQQYNINGVLTSVLTGVECIHPNSKFYTIVIH